MRFADMFLFWDQKQKNTRGFTLVELLIVISIITLLMSILLPSLRHVREQSKTAICTGNLKQFGLAILTYFADNDGYFPPAYQSDSSTHWWGQKKSDGIDYTKGFAWPYLQTRLRKKSLYECPSQPYGSYNLQAKPAGAPDEPRWITSTYGYNGYYLSPPRTAWPNIKSRPWRKVTSVLHPAEVFVFADTLLDRDTTGDSPNVENNALLDPPYLYTSSGWRKNDFPTTCFRHLEKTSVLFADIHCQLMGLEEGEYTHPISKIGSVGSTNAPYYIPDYEKWPLSKRSRR
jgi:prepilin-type N-terminal cleavage/methylation domain-containing protein